MENRNQNDGLVAAWDALTAPHRNPEPAALVIATAVREIDGHHVEARLEHFHDVPVVMLAIDGIEYMTAIDVGRALELNDPSNATRVASSAAVDADERRLVKDKLLHGLREVVSQWNTTSISKYAPSVLLVTRSGAESIAMESRTPRAREFKRWIRKDALPALREAGDQVTLRRLESEEAQRRRDFAMQLMNYVVHGTMAPIPAPVPPIEPPPMPVPELPKPRQDAPADDGQRWHRVMKMSNPAGPARKRNGHKALARPTKREYEPSTTDSRISAAIDLLDKYPDAKSFEITAYLLHRFGVGLDMHTIIDLRRAAGQIIERESGIDRQIPERFRAIRELLRENPDASDYDAFVRLRELGLRPMLSPETMQRFRSAAQRAQARRKSNGQQAATHPGGAA